MAKSYSDTRIIDNKGNARLTQYCAVHKPQLVWRRTPNDDIGIDGEIELYDGDGNPLSEIIKVQLKSSERDKGYIKNENPITKTFTFYAKRSDVEYWQKLQNDVLLIVYDNRNGVDRLYAKKIENIDLKHIGSKSVPIQFHQEYDLLDQEKNDFLLKFSRFYNSTNPILKPIFEGIEVLTSNLLKVSFPTNRIYVAPINFDRDEIIEKSQNTARTLRKNASARDVAKNALWQKNLQFSSDWTVFNKNIITFHDLNDKTKPIAQIIDDSCIESFSVDEFCSISEDYKKLFKSLVRYCMQQVLFKLDFEWDIEDKIFKVIAPVPINKNMEKKETWMGNVQATRVVFKAVYWDKGKIYYCTHLAFQMNVENFNDDWFLCINPTWSVTIDGKKKSKVGYKKVTQQKRLERNQSVLNHLRFIAYKILSRDLFTYQYPFLTFHELVKFNTNVIINEDDWLKTETKEEKVVLKDIEDSNLTIDED